MNDNKFLLAKELVQGYCAKIVIQKYSLEQILKEMQHDLYFLNGQIAINKQTDADNNSYAHDRRI